VLTPRHSDGFPTERRHRHGRWTANTKRKGNHVHCSPMTPIPRYPIFFERPLSFLYQTGHSSNAAWAIETSLAPWSQSIGSIIYWKIASGNMRRHPVRQCEISARLDLMVDWYSNLNLRPLSSQLNNVPGHRASKATNTQVQRNLSLD
jgi:hypothetical protein